MAGGVLLRESSRTRARTAVSGGAVRVDGKQFAVDDRRFAFRGVSYGTFPARADGALFPEARTLERDLGMIAEAGFTVVRTYTEPPDDLLALAGEHGLRVMCDVAFADWRWTLGAGRREFRRVTREAVAHAAAQARRLAGREEVLALSIGNEVPADVVRWLGTQRIAHAMSDMVAAVREAAPDRLVSYANYPTAEYLPLDDLDFLMFNVFLEQRDDFRRYLARLHHLAGDDRPVVLGETGLHVGDGPDAERRQAEVLDWQLELALERGVGGVCVFSWTDEWAVEGKAVGGWQFGLTRADRSPRPALEVAARWNRRTVADLKEDWPAISVVICAHNAEATIDECLLHTCALDYPDLDVLVVDDGSTDRTAEIVGHHPRARLLSIPPSGLSAARNAGLAAAKADLVAYLDSDAYPSPEWPYYLVLGVDETTVGAVGGPNVVPPDAPLGEQAVAHAPGGPLHVLVSDDRAEHIPGCNMAFFRHALAGVGGFDPALTSAGDDVDVCWKVLDAGWQIAFHPAALVWHHRRADARAYFRQQRGYGRAEALVQDRHPDRYTPLGTARWTGRIYRSLPPALVRNRVYQGAFGAAAYQSVYRVGGHGLDVAHQLGVPVAALAALTAPLGLLAAPLALPALVALVVLVVLGALDAFHAGHPARGTERPLAFRLLVAAMHVGQPLVRLQGRLAQARARQPGGQAPDALMGPIEQRGRTLVLPADRERVAFAAAVIGHLRRARLPVLIGSGWEDHDARVRGSVLVSGELLTTAFPAGCFQLRVRRRLESSRAALVVGFTIMAVVLVHPLFAGFLVAAAAADVARGLWRTGPAVRQVVRKAAG